MIEGTFDADAGTIEWAGITYKLKGYIDTRKYNELDVINQMADDFYAQYGRNAIVYTNKGTWDKIEDSAGLKDNVCEKTTLFLAWWGAIPPVYGEDNNKLPIGWYGYELWNDAAEHYKLMAGDSLEKLLSYAYLGDGSSSGGTSGGSTTVTSGTLTVNLNIPDIHLYIHNVDES